MGRSFAHSETSISLNPATGAAAAIPVLALVAIVAALCASHQRKSSSSSGPNSPREPSPQSSRSTKYGNKEDGEPTLPPPLPVAAAVLLEEKLPTLPPKEKTNMLVVVVDDVSHGPIAPCVPPAAAARPSRRRLSMTLSLKIPEGLARIRTGLRERQQGRAAGPATATAAVAAAREGEEEDSVWRKAIILGERCRVPSGDDEEEATAVYDESGKRVRNYRPRTPRSLPVSRTNSFAVVKSDMIHLDPMSVRQPLEESHCSSSTTHY